jgi:hypothetical protein
MTLCGIERVLAIPPDKMKVRLHDETPGSTFLPSQAKPEYRIVLFQIQVLPAGLGLVDQIAYLVTVMHPVPGVGRKVIDLLPAQLSELQERRMNDQVPFILRPFASLAPRLVFLPISSGYTPRHPGAETASILDGLGSSRSFSGGRTGQMRGEPRGFARWTSVQVSWLSLNIYLGKKRRFTGLEFLLCERLAMCSRFAFLSHRATRVMSSIREAQPSR